MHRHSSVMAGGEFDTIVSLSCHIPGCLVVIILSTFNSWKVSCREEIGREEVTSWPSMMRTMLWEHMSVPGLS